MKIDTELKNFLNGIRQVIFQKNHSTNRKTKILEGSI